MTMDKDAADLLALRIKAGAPAYSDLSPEAARADMKAAREAMNLTPEEVGEVQDFVAKSPEADIRLRFYRPDKDRESGRLPLLIFYHGGGWVIGDIDTHDFLCRQLTNAVGCAVLSVDYRLAPEHKFPAAVDDSMEAMRWAFANADQLDVDVARVAVGGDSAGGNLSAVMAIYARDGLLPSIRYQMLIYPCTDLTMTRRSYDVDEEGLPLSTKTMFWFRDHYLRGVEDEVDWRASPLFAPSLKGVAPAYVMTVGFDPLADEGDAYVRRLRQAGVEVEHRHYPGQIHGLVTLGAFLPTAEPAIAEVCDRLRTALFD